MSKPAPATAAEPSALAYADGWVERLREHLPQAVATWDAEAIHQSRVATRRLKAMLDVAEPVLSKGHLKPLGKTLRKLRRQLGPLRDLDVMLDHLGGFRPGPGVDWLRARFDAGRAGQRDDVADRLHPAKALGKLGAWWAVRQEWAEAADAVDGLMADSVHLQLDAFAEQANALATGDPHAVRIAGKALRYTLEMAVAAGHPLPPAVAKAFKRMQDALGAWHDMAVLAERSLHAALDAGLAYHDAERCAAVLDVARTAVARSQRHLAAFEDLWAKQGETLTEAIRTAFPLSHADAATGPQTGPGPLGSAGTPDPALAPQVDPVAG